MCVCVCVCVCVGGIQLPESGLFTVERNSAPKDLSKASLKALCPPGAKKRILIYSFFPCSDAPFESLFTSCFKSCPIEPEIFQVSTKR